MFDNINYLLFKFVSGRPVFHTLCLRWGIPNRSSYFGNCICEHQDPYVRFWPNTTGKKNDTWMWTKLLLVIQ